MTSTTTKGVKILPDGTVSVVALEGRHLGLSDVLWESLKTEMNTSILGVQYVVTKSEDALYLFFYDDTGDHYGVSNEKAEDLSGLVWYGPCIIMKTKPSGRTVTEEDIHKENQEFVDAISAEEERDMRSYLVSLEKSMN